jgi:hypothetical protein
LGGLSEERIQRAVGGVLIFALIVRFGLLDAALIVALALYVLWVWATPEADRG